MTQRHVLLCATLLTLVLTFIGCQTAPPPQPKTDVAADIKAINALRDQVATTFNSTDAAALAACYADDAVMMNPSQAAVEGKPAIQLAYEAMFKEEASNLAVKLVFTPLETQVVGDWAYDRGNSTAAITPKSGKPMEESGKYLVILKRQPDGSWKVYREITNNNAPPRSAAGKKK